MKVSKYIWHIAKTNILKKKQRTWLSLTAVCLSTAIIFTSMTLFKNVYSFSKNTDYETIGNYHYATYSKASGIDVFARYNKSLDTDTSLYGIYDNQIINLRSLTIDDVEQPSLPFVLKEGRVAENEQEVLVSDSLGLEIGSQIELNLGTLSYEENPDNLYHYPENLDASHTSDTQAKTYQIVGIYTCNEQFLKTTSNILPIYTYLDNAASEGVYYVKDEQIHLTDSFSYFLNKMDVVERYVITNTAVVSNDSIKNFLQDTTILLVMFIIIAIIGMSMSLISVHNVILISDKDRKKELGLLKSIGARPCEVKRLLQIELITLGVLGALLGIVLGALVSYFVLNLFIERIYVTFSLSMIFNPWLLLLAFIGGLSLMYFSGMKAYRQYINSSAISDLKNFSYEYGQPLKPKLTRRRTFEWQMFMIYNGRMKKQTRNIFHSFVLYLMTTVLFISIFLSNVIYENKYTSRDYDFDVTNYHSELNEKGGLWDVNPQLAYHLYDKVDNQEINANYIYGQRLLNSGYYWTRTDLYDEDMLSMYKSVATIGLETETYIDPDTKEEALYTNVYHSPTALDAVQLEELKPYLVAGSVDDLTINDVVAIYDEDDRLGVGLGKNFKIGDSVYLGKQKKTVAAIAHIPTSKLFDKDGASLDMHFAYCDYARVLALSLDALIADGKANQVSENIYIDLMNTSTASSTQEEIGKSMTETGTSESYVCNSIAIIVETNRFATFIIEALLYPLFLMLFIVSLMNINNVFVGNVHLKRNDISIMKSVGMTGTQLNMLFTFEYIEGYVNAAGIVTLTFIPLAILQGQLNIASSFDFGANIIGTLLIALTLLGILLVAPLVIATLKRIRRILPIENLKDVD